MVSFPLQINNFIRLITFKFGFSVTIWWIFNLICWNLQDLSQKQNYRTFIVTHSPSRKTQKILVLSINAKIYIFHQFFYTFSPLLLGLLIFSSTCGSFHFDMETAIFFTCTLIHHCSYCHLSSFTLVLILFTDPSCMNNVQLWHQIVAPIT